MTIIARARRLQALSVHKLSISTIERRIRNEWSDDKIINRPAQRKPPKDHPLKSACWHTVATRKGWKTDGTI